MFDVKEEDMDEVREIDEAIDHFDKMFWRRASFSDGGKSNLYRLAIAAIEDRKAIRLGFSGYKCPKCGSEIDHVVSVMGECE